MTWGKYDISFIYDKPVSYKNLLIYPVPLENYFEFYTCAQCLTIDKNSIPDPKVISMSYLEYLFYASKEDIEKYPYLIWMDYLLKLVLRKLDDKEFKIDYGYTNDGKPVFQINGELFNSSDFEEIKNIICEYNLLELPDESIQKEVRDKMEEAKRLRAQDGDKMAGLEDLMVCVSVATSYTFEDVRKMSIRKFIKYVERINKLVDYQIYRTAAASGFVKFEGKDKEILRHWMSEVKKDKFDELISEEGMQDKISFKDKMKQNN